MSLDLMGESPVLVRPLDHRQPRPRANILLPSHFFVSMTLTPETKRFEKLPDTTRCDALRVATEDTVFICLQVSSFPQELLANLELK